MEAKVLRKFNKRQFILISITLSTHFTLGYIFPRSFCLVKQRKTSEKNSWKCLTEIIRAQQVQSFPLQILHTKNFLQWANSKQIK